MSCWTNSPTAPRRPTSGCRNVTGRVEPDDPVIVDGDHGQVFVRPAEDVRQAFQQNQKMRQQRRAIFWKTKA